MLVLFDVSCLAFLFALFLTPLVWNAATRMGLVDKPDATRKFHLGPVPRVGGVSVALAYALAMGFIYVPPYRNVPFDIPSGMSAAWKLAPAAIVILLIGLADDIRGLRPWQKLLGEVAAAVIAYESGFGVHVLRGQPVSDWLSPIVTVVWLVGCSNALNLIDGIDGLAAGVGVFATLTAFVAALMHNSLELALVTAPLVGALLGFLRYNFNPASIFLGDSGSLMIGFLLGCFGVVWSQKSATILGMTAPLMALGIPILDTGLSIVRRFLRHQPIFGADRDHIHHRLLKRGLAPRRVALVLYGVASIGAALSLLSVSSNRMAGAVVLLFCAAAWIGIQHLGYTEFSTARRMLLAGTFQQTLDAQLRVRSFEQALAAAKSVEECWGLILDASRTFDFVEARLCVAGTT